MTYVIAQPCVDVKDKACVDECPVDCIYEGSRTLYINPDECIDCGACEPVCPVEAIFYEDDVPDDWAWYKDAAEDLFKEVGNPGGAADYGPIDHDEPRVASLPRQTTFVQVEPAHGSERAKWAKRADAPDASGQPGASGQHS